MTRVVVVGAGIAGLTAAWRLVNGEPPPAVTVFEADGRVGGKIRAEELAGLTLETGADAFLASEPDAERLARLVGLGGDLLGPSISGVDIWAGGRLRRMPPGVVLGVPTDLGALLRSRLVSPFAVARAAYDLVGRPPADTSGTSVGRLTRARLGDSVTDRLVDPLLAGVYAGDIDRLEAGSATPALTEAIEEHGSLIRGTRARIRRGASRRAIPFVTVAGGLSRLPGALAATPGVDLRTAVSVKDVRPHEGGWLVAVDASGVVEHHRADAVVLATPATTTAELLRSTVPEAVGPLGQIPYVSVAVVTLVLPAGTAVPHGSGLLVARTEGRAVKAATWVSMKWPHVAPGGEVVIRASVGRRDEESALQASDHELVTAVRGDLADLAGVAGEPTATRVTRWERALPQYELGHRERVARIDEAIARHPGLEVAGAAYRGVGITPCVRDGESAARRVLAHLAAGEPG